MGLPVTKSFRQWCKFKGIRHTRKAEKDKELTQKYIDECALFKPPADSTKEVGSISQETGNQ